MKEHPILFTGEMVRAILAGRKTMTRRVIKPQPPNSDYQVVTLIDSTCREKRKHNGKHHWAIVKDLDILADQKIYFKCPYGMPGDRLWVRENIWQTGYSYNAANPESGCNDPKWAWTNKDAKYQATDQKPEKGYCGRPSIHMPRWASRINLLVKDIRVERVKDISETDAIAEGIDMETEFGSLCISIQDESCYENDLVKGSAVLTVYRKLWDSINPKRGFGWNANPWVWVVEFEE